MQALFHIATDLNAMVMERNWRQFSLYTTGVTLLSGVCAYGGTFFFTKYSPLSAAMYIGTAALVSQIVYRFLEEIKEHMPVLLFKRPLAVVQLLQIPFWFYFLHGGDARFLSAAVKLEVIAATAYFAAIPLFFFLAIEAVKDPTEAKIGAALGVMLPLASGLKIYAGQFA